MVRLNLATGKMLGCDNVAGFNLLQELGNPALNARQATVQRGAFFGNGEITGFMEIGINDAANVDGVVAKIDNSPADNIVLMLVMTANPAAEDLVHEQTAILA